MRRKRCFRSRVHALGIISPPFSRKRNEVGNFSMNFSRNPGNEFPLSFFFLQLENFKNEEESKKFVERFE